MKRNEPEKKRSLLPLVTFILLFVIFYIYIFRPAITGFVTLTKEASYNESLNLVFNESSEYMWYLTNVGELKSLKLTGSLTEGAKAKIYLEYSNSTFLIFDNTQLTEDGLKGITGLVVSNETITNTTEPAINETAVNETVTNETTTNQTVINETEPAMTKSISMGLEYKGNSTYDENNDGIETLTGIIDFYPDTSFNWDVSYDKLCAKWEVYSSEDESSTIVCYGSPDCCSLLGLTPEKTEWNETFYLNYGKYGITANNIVTAHVIYANYSLDAENIYSDIVYSNLSSLTAKFFPIITTDFDRICIDTCSLSGLDSDSYKLVIEISNGTLTLDSVTYSILTTIINSAPVLLENISAVYINKNGNLTIDLNEYFTDEDNDELTYAYYGIENITILIDNNLADFIPDVNFTGTRYTFFTANDTVLTAVSNVLAIEVGKKEEKANKTKSTIEKPAKWIKRIVLEEMVSGLGWPAGGYNLTISETDDEKLERAKIKIKEDGNKISIDENSSTIEMEYDSPRINSTGPPALTYSILPSKANKAAIQLHWPVDNSTLLIDFNLVCEGRIKNIEVKKSEIK